MPFNSGRVSARQLNGSRMSDWVLSWLRLRLKSDLIVCLIRRLGILTRAVNSNYVFIC